MMEFRDLISVFMEFFSDPPNIEFSSPNRTFIEGQRVSLVCNVTGSELLNVTWRRIGGGSYSEGSLKQFSSISRHDEAVYECMAHNGDECPTATAIAKVTVICKNHDFYKYNNAHL